MELVRQLLVRFHDNESDTDIGIMNAAFVGRQPIYTRDLEVAAYEVLYRNGLQNSAMVSDGDSATAGLILNMFAEIGFEQIVGNLPAFINVTRNFILDEHALALPKERVVLEVLEDIQPEEEIVESLRNLSEHGFTIALDDFVYSPRMLPLIEVADIIKVELPAIPAADLQGQVAELRKHNVKLLAEKVETYEEFETCKDLGFDYFQGYFFCKPKVIQGKRVPINQVAALQLLSELSRPEIRIDDLTKILSTEPSLCYKLMRFVNSAVHARSRKVSSVQSAIVFVGLKRLISFLRLAMLARAADEKPTHLLATALTRAKMCELLATAANKLKPETYFVAGMFSVLDALLDKPLPDALESLPLENDIRLALLDGEGPMGEIVQSVIGYEQAATDEREFGGLDELTVRSAYLESLIWTAEVSSSTDAMMA